MPVYFPIFQEASSLPLKTWRLVYPLGGEESDFQDAPAESGSGKGREDFDGNFGEEEKAPGDNVVDGKMDLLTVRAHLHMTMNLSTKSQRIVDEVSAKDFSSPAKFFFTEKL